MSTMILARAFHFFGLILWMGGIVTVSTLAVALTADVRKQALGAVRATVLRLITPGMIIAWIGGLAMLLPNFTTLYARAGWMHTKLLLVLVASALTGVISGAIRKGASGEADFPEGRVRKLGLANLVILMIVIFLAVWQPGT